MIDALRARGYAVIPSPAGDDPWSLVEALVGTRPMMVERQPIRPLAGARSFAGSSAFTPVHTDSQDFLGAPPGLQVMVCRRAAASGGETRLVDGWALLDQIERDDPALHDALFAVPRLHRFYFGDVTRPTISELRGHVAWTHSPIPSSDPIGVALARALDRAPVIELAIRSGETLVVDNHRMLHGRTPFEDTDRDFVRLLAWFAQPLAAHPRYRASRAGGDLGRLAVVLEMLTGVAPARLAAREGVAEAELYTWRNRALAAALAAFDGK